MPAKRLGILFLLPVILLMLCRDVYAGRNLVVIETNLGDITVELYQDKAPVTVANFLNYVDEGFYTDTVFHRVIEDFVTQAGAYDPNLYEVDFSQYSEDNPFNLKDPNQGYKAPGDPIELETTATALKNLQYTIAMARLSSPKNSATSQFYINFKANTSLDSNYAVFGIVIDGFDVVDAMNGVETFQDPDDDSSVTNYDDVTAYFGEDLPITPIVISRIYRTKDFEDDSSSDFSDVDFLKATDGGIRTYVLENYEENSDDSTYADGDIWSYEFSTDTVLGVKCLKWRTNAQDADPLITDKTFYMARDTDGDIYILKEVKNEESTTSKQTLYEATDLSDARPISYYAAYIMQFRLIAGTYDPTNLASASNKITLGSGSSTETQEIISVNSTLTPNYTDPDVVVVKKYRGLSGSETSIEYYYYHKDDGLILYLQDENQAVLTGIGWWLDQKIFNSSSTDFSDVPFLMIDEAFVFTRTFVGMGENDDDNFTQSISYPTAKFNNVNYVTWIQNGIPEQGIRNFEIHMARDTNGEIWVFYYKTDLQVVYDFDILTEAVKLETLANDYVLFALVAGVYNSDDVNSPDNFYTRNENGTTINEKIVAFDATLSHIPVSQNHLVKVKRWEGDAAAENDNNIWYFSPRVGLLRNYRNGETGVDGDGWAAAHYGGLFKTDLNDMSEVDFLKAAVSDTKLYYGSKDYTGDDRTMSFTSLTVGGLKALRWINAQKDVSTNLFDIQLVRDHLNRIWILRYRINGTSEFYVGSTTDAYLSARPLSYYTDKNMHFKLICGDYDSSLPYNPNDPNTFVNKIAYTQNSKEITEAIVDFNASLPDVPYYNNDLFLVKYECPSDPNDLVRWKYYHKDDGLVREIYSTINVNDDFANTNSYRLAWGGNAKPTFSSTSSDFSKVDFLYAQPGTIKLMQGQGQYEDSSYLVQYRVANYLGVQCLEEYTDLSEIENINTQESLLLARDATSEKYWVLKHTLNDQTLFAAPTIDQAVPLDRWPDLRWQLCAEEKEIGDSFSHNNTTKTIIDDDVKITQRAGLGKTLTVLKHSWDPTGIVDGYSYLGSGEGMVLTLLDNFISSSQADPNYDNTSMIQAGSADGFWQVEEEALENPQIKFSASKNRTANKVSDSFVLTGDFELASSDFEGKPLIFVVGKWSVTIDTTSSSFKKHSSTRYSYSGTVGTRGKVQLILDLAKDTFQLKASRIDLTGTIEPVEITMVAGEEIYQNSAKVLGNMPVYYNVGLYDSMQAYSYKRKWNDSRKGDKIWVKGGITATSNIDLTKIKTLTVKWGTATSADIAVKYIKKSGNRNRYYYKDSTAVFRSVIIDWDNSSFEVYMVKDSLAAPSQTLYFTITDTDGNKIFEQNALVD